MLDFYLVNINRREFIKLWPLDFSLTLVELLKSGWKLEHILNLHYEGNGFSLQTTIEKGFKLLVSPIF